MIIIPQVFVGICAGLGAGGWFLLMFHYRKRIERLERQADRTSAMLAAFLKIAGAPQCPHTWIGDDHLHRCQWPEMAEHDLGHCCECGAWSDVVAK